MEIIQKLKYMYTTNYEQEFLHKFAIFTNLNAHSNVNNYMINNEMFNNIYKTSK